VPKITSSETKQEFLRLVSGGATNGQAAKACGFSAARVSAWSKASAEFSEALAKARQDGQRAKRVRSAQQARTFLAALTQEATPAAAPAPATVPPATPEALPVVKPIAIGVIKGDVLFIEPSRLAHVLELARNAQA